MTESKVEASVDAVTDDGPASRADAGRDRCVGRRASGSAAQAWLNGPTAEERAAYARRLRQRRLADAFDDGEARIADGVRRACASGARASSPPKARWRSCYRWSRRTFADLVRAGREWEEETSLPTGAGASHGRRGILTVQSCDRAPVALDPGTGSAATRRR